MRSLFWTKIPDKVIDKTVWAGLSDEAIKLDIDSLERSFCKALAKVAAGESHSVVTLRF